MLNRYGETKLQGEQTVKAELKEYFIVRIAWVFGKNRNNFVKTMLEQGKDGKNFEWYVIRLERRLTQQILQNFLQICR